MISVDGIPHLTKFAFSTRINFNYRYCCLCSVVQSVEFPPAAKVVEREQVVLAAPREQVSSDFLPGKDGFSQHERFFLLGGS